MMRFFVRNLFAKLLLLGILAAPLALFALNEFRQLADPGFAREPKPAASETELKRTQDEAAGLAAMPSDLRRELFFPGGRTLNDSSEPFAELGKSVRSRAGILDAHRRFLLQYNSTALSGDLGLKLDPAFTAGAGKDLSAHYSRLWSDRRDQLVSKTRLTDLRAQIAKADAKTLEQLAKDIRIAADDYERRWPGESIVAMLREDLVRQQVQLARDAAELENTRMEASWRRLMQLPSPDAIKAVQPQVEALLKQLKSLLVDLQTRNDLENAKLTDERIAMWSKRRDFLPEVLTLLEGMDKMLADARIPDFFAACKRLAAAYPTDETRGLVRGAAEEFCTRFLIKQPKDPVKYDDIVIVVGLDKVQKEVPRRQVKVYFKDGERRFLVTGDPLKNDGFTEFQAEQVKDSIRHLTVFDSELKDPLPGGLLTQIAFDKAQLKPTPKSAAVRFYCDEYRKVDRWNATAIRDFMKKCEAHNKHLGEIWNRLESLDRAMSDERELFAPKTS